VSLEGAAKALRVNSLTIRRMEKAEVGLKIPYVEKLLQTYGADKQETDEFIDLAEQANRPGWWHRYRGVLPGWFTAYVSLESDAQTLRTYEPHYVTGLLQTHAYARAILRAGFPNDGDEDLEHPWRDAMTGSHAAQDIDTSKPHSARIQAVASGHSRSSVAQLPRFGWGSAELA
jgi:hypothetical protein